MKKNAPPTAMPAAKSTGRSNGKSHASSEPPPPRSHGYSTAGADPVRSNMVKPGRFGFLFPELSTSPWTTGSPTTDAQVAEELGAAMHAPVTSPTPGVIPAGFTYFGQFVDHDITFDPTSLGENAVDVADLVNFRSPALDLDSLYGSGPRDQPFLYRRQTDTSANQFILGPVKDSGPGPGTELPQVHALDGAAYDLPRTCFLQGDATAILGDKRNDENLIVAQLHRTMLHFHNAICLAFPEKSFLDVRRLVIHHYQRILLNQFLPLIVGQQAVDDAMAELKFYRIGPGELATEPFIPLEFSGAAYRFGHSMVRSKYEFNRVFAAGTDFRLAFAFTGDGFATAPGGPLLQYPTNWLLDFGAFFPDLGRTPQMAAAIDASISDQLMIGAPPGRPLAALNLLRGSMHYKLPTGQAVAGRMGMPLLTKAELESGTGGAVIKKFNIGEHTPLWFYLLKEAEVKAGSQHLGPTGAAIVAEVFVGLLKDDPESLLGNPPKPGEELPSADGKFKIADLFNFTEKHKGQGNIPAAGVINPLA